MVAYMDDFGHANTFMLVFGLAFALYGIALARTGNAALLPYSSAHSARTSDDVRRVGRIVVRVGLGLAVICGMLALGLARG